MTIKVWNIMEQVTFTVFKQIITIMKVFKHRTLWANCNCSSSWMIFNQNVKQQPSIHSLFISEKLNWCKECGTFIVNTVFRFENERWEYTCWNWTKIELMKLYRNTNKMHIVITFIPYFFGASKLELVSLNKVWTLTWSPL